MDAWLWWLLAGISMLALAFVAAVVGSLAIAIFAVLFFYRSENDPPLGFTGRLKRACLRILSITGKILSRIAAVFVVLGLMLFARPGRGDRLG